MYHTYTNNVTIMTGLIWLRTGAKVVLYDVMDIRVSKKAGYMLNN